MEKVKSEIPFNYVTIKTTKSRIDKGLLAIPISLISIFPQKSGKIYLLNEKEELDAKSFTAYNSSSRECRIGGLKSFYDRYNISDGDELVIQVLGDNKFRIIPEKLFKSILSKNLSSFESSKDDEDIEKNLLAISKITNLREEEILKNKFIDLANEEIKKRSRINKKITSAKENVPYFIREILLHLYKGRCQLTNFTFLMQNNKPYFEIHHINPDKGNNVKNLLVVSPNIHAQFTFANVEHTFDDNGWLRKVKFNLEEHDVFQIIDNLPMQFEKEIHY